MDGKIKYFQQISHEAAGKISITVGGGGSFLDWVMDDLAEWLDLFLKFGNSIALIFGLYLTIPRVLARFRMNRDLSRRESDANFKK